MSGQRIVALFLFLILLAVTLIVFVFGPYPAGAGTFFLVFPSLMAILALIRVVTRTDSDKFVERAEASLKVEKWLKDRGYREVFYFSITKRAVTRFAFRGGHSDYEYVVVCKTDAPRNISKKEVKFYESDSIVQKYEDFDLVLDSYFVIWLNKSLSRNRLFTSL